MDYVFEDMLTVRVHREDRALNQLAKARVALEQAEALKRLKEKELNEYRVWRCTEEQRLYANLKSRMASLKDLMLFVDTTAILRQDQGAKAQQADEAGNQVVKAEEELQTAKQEYSEAFRKKAKIEEHKDIWMEEMRVLEEHSAEKELEEVGIKTR